VTTRLSPGNSNGTAIQEEISANERNNEEGETKEGKITKKRGLVGKNWSIKFLQIGVG